MGIGEWADDVLDVMTNIQCNVLDRQQAPAVDYQQGDRKIETLRREFDCATDSTIDAVAAKILDVLHELLIKEEQPSEHINAVLHHWTMLWALISPARYD